MTFGGDGYLYGTTLATVFRLAPPSTKSGRWRETILYTFTQEAYGPQGSLILDQSGNLYGTVYVGRGDSLRGNVFRIKQPAKKSATWAFDILHGFTGIPDGENPAAPLIFDKDSKLDGTTQYGGTGSGCGSAGCGTVFEVWR